MTQHTLPNQSSGERAHLAWPRWYVFLLPLLLLLPLTSGIAQAGLSENTRVKAGGFKWFPDADEYRGPVRVVVSLGAQNVRVYREGELIGLSSISSGKRGHETPAGVFPILEKRRVYFSRKYDDAPMPYMLRLTWKGVAMHGGYVPGHRASHGCIRLPRKFAAQLFDLVRVGQRVTVTHGSGRPLREEVGSR